MSESLREHVAATRARHHTLHIEAGITPLDLKLEFDGKPLEGVKRVAFEMNAQELTVVTLEVYVNLSVSAELVAAYAHLLPPTPAEHDEDGQPIPALLSAEVGFVGEHQRPRRRD